MRVVISSGHGKYIRGASGYIDEVDEARLVVEDVATALRELGVETITYHDDVSDDQSENLNRIVDFHNSKTRDLDVSVHFNHSGGASQSGPIGTEVWYVSSAGMEHAEEVVDGIAAASGLKNRGVKYTDGLFFLNNTEEPAILIEVCFVNSRADCDLYRENFTDICSAIAESISGEEHAPGPGPGPEPGPEPPEPLPPSAEQTVIAIAANSAIAQYEWKDRGVAPDAYINGFALAWTTVVQKFHAGDSAVLEMAKANTGDDDVDALSVYNSDFEKLGMSNRYAGIDTLRHLFALLLGHGMRESSGQHCCGRDQSASNTSSDTCEAGLYQTSYNAHTCTDEFDKVMVGYDNGRWPCYLEEFAEGISCSDDDWENYGSGPGEDFQRLCKECPPFAMESCALVLRNRCQHYGPIIRKETELRREADWLLLDIQRYLMSHDDS